MTQPMEKQTRILKVTKNLPARKTVKGGYVIDWRKTQELRIGKWSL